MKKIVLLLMLFIFAFKVEAQDKKAVLQVIETQRRAWNRGDIDAYMQGYWKSDSLLFVGKAAPVHGWKGILKRYKKAYPGKAAMGILTFTILKVDVLDPNNAFVLGGWSLKRKKDAPGGYFTLWFRKIDGKWKIVCDHTS